MSVTAHRSEVEAQVPAPRTERKAPARVVRRAPAHRPPNRHRAVRVGAPRVVASCAPRRPRLSVVWVLAVAAAACAAVYGLGSLSNAVGPSVPSETAVVRVKPGESLWELAGRVAPGSDVSAVVERIRELNGVEGAVQPGQPLTVPVG